MRNKIILVISAIILASVYYFLHLQGKADKKDEQAQTIQHNVQDNTKKTKSIQQKLKEQKAKQAEKDKKIKEKNKAKQETPIKPIFDADPVVDANVLIKKNIFCIQMLAKGTNLEKYINRYSKNFNPKQINHLKKTYEHCKQVNQQHPEYHLADIKQIQKQKSDSKATSIWGKILKGEVQADELSDVEIESILQQNDPNILLDAPRQLRHYYQKVIHWDLEETIGNHQYDYTEQVEYYAHQLYLCQLGSDCSSTSTTMSTMCFINADSCGLNFPQFIKTILTAGQQADVQLALNYLKRKYN